ncbi:MAG: response regulator [Minisyncoccia bacterium]
MKILVVEDEEALAKIFAEKLNEAGYLIEIAGDGEAALSLAKSFNPDGIVLDLRIPKKDGFEVLEALKMDEALRAIPVIVVSNLMLDTDIKRALQLGAADYFVKAEHPINAIVEKITTMLSSSK